MTIKPNNENGQALVEVCVGLIAIMIVFLGVFFISAVGIDNIRALTTARENADKRNFTTKATSIKKVTYGEDGIPFTGDDVYNNGGIPDSKHYINSLSTNAVIYPFDDSRLEDQELPKAVTKNSIFINASNLKGSRGNNTHFVDVLQKVHLMAPLKTFFGIKSIDLNSYKGNQVFFPDLQSID